MARFYFLLQEADKLYTDPEGADLPDVSAARQEAVLAARDILSNAIKTGRAKVPEAFVIADEAGRKLDVVPLAAVLPEQLKR
jgi:plasmid stability protein